MLRLNYLGENLPGKNSWNLLIIAQSANGSYK